MNTKLQEKNLDFFKTRKLIVVISKDAIRLKDSMALMSVDVTLL